VDKFKNFRRDKMNILRKPKVIETKEKEQEKEQEKEKEKESIILYAKDEKGNIMAYKVSGDKKMLGQINGKAVDYTNHLNAQLLTNIKTVTQKGIEVPKVFSQMWGLFLQELNTLSQSEIQQTYKEIVSYHPANDKFAELYQEAQAELTITKTEYGEEEKINFQKYVTGIVIQHKKLSFKLTEAEFVTEHLKGKLPLDTDVDAFAASCDAARKEQSSAKATPASVQ